MGQKIIVKKPKEETRGSGKKKYYDERGKIYLESHVLIFGKYIQVLSVKLVAKSCKVTDIIITIDKKKQ